MIGEEKYIWRLLMLLPDELRKKIMEQLYQLILEESEKIGLVWVKEEG